MGNYIWEGVVKGGGEGVGSVRIGAYHFYQGGGSFPRSSGV